MDWSGTDCWTCFARMHRWAGSSARRRRPGRPCLSRTRPRRRVQHGPGRRHDPARRLRHRQQRHARRPELDHRRPLRRRAELQRQHRHRPRLGLAGPRDDDAGGVGAAERARRQLAYGPAQGGARRTRLLALRPRRVRPAVRAQHRRREDGGRHLGTSAEHLDAHRCHVRRGHDAVLRQRDAGRPACADRRGPRDHEPAADRRQHDLGRALRGRHRRGADLRPRAHGGRDPGRHEPAGRRGRHRAADGADQPERHRLARQRSAELDRRHRQRERGPLQRPPRDHAGLHAERGQPRRPAHRHELHRHPAGRRLLLQGHRRGRLRQRRSRLQRAERAGRRPHRAERPRHAERDRRHRPRDPHLGRRHRQRGRGPLQRPPLDHARLHAKRRQPHRAAHGHQPDRHRRGRHVLLQGHRRGRGRQRRPADERGERGRHRRHAGADHPHQPRRRHGRPDREPGLDRVDRQRRRHPLQRPPLHDLGLHAERREPDRPARLAELRRRRAAVRHLLLQGDRRGRGRQHQRPLQPG